MRSLLRGRTYSANVDTSLPQLSAPSDLRTWNTIRDAALSRGLVDVKVTAIDADRSGLKLDLRRENRS